MVRPSRERGGESAMASGDEGRGGARKGPGRRSTEAALEYLQGTVRALGAGSRTFQERLDSKRAFDPAAPSNLLGALVAGAASYLEAMSKVASDVAQRLQDEDEGGPKAQ
jgi:hypothetical protein